MHSDRCDRDFDFEDSFKITPLNSNKSKGVNTFRLIQQIEKNIPLTQCWWHEMIQTRLKGCTQTYSTTS